MTRLPRYCEIINRYREQVEAHMTATYGKRRYKRLSNSLMKALAATLMTGRKPADRVADRELSSLLRKAEQQLAKDEYDLPKAWYERRTYGTGRSAAASRWHVKPLELKYLEQLWSDLRYSRDEYEALIKKAGVEWPFDVDRIHHETVVWLDDKAIEDIVLVALEAYAVPRQGVRFTETYGICFGSTKTTEEKRQGHGRHVTRYIRISSVHIQLRAECYSNKVTYDLRSLETQMEVAKVLFPQLDIVGDFHTHPYGTVKQLKQARGWRYSEADEAVIPTWVMPLKKKGYHPRASLVVAVAAGTRRISRPGRLRNNVIRFSVNKYHFYVACYRILGNRYTDENLALHPIALPAL
jgi:hypothetical protein